MTSLSIPTTVVLLAFAIAFVLGVISARTQFCTLGAVSDIVNMGDFSRMRMWVLAMAVAIIGAQALHVAGLIDLSKAFYVRPTVTWLSYVIGGLAFGVGMTLSSGCGSRTLVRIGGGNVKSLVVFVFMGIAAYMTMKGLFGVWRVSFLDVVNVDLASRGLATQQLPQWLGGAIALGLLIFVLMGREFRSNVDGWLGGLGYGLAVVAGWYVSAHIGFGENSETLENVYFATNSRSPESLTFVAPAAYSLELLMLWSDKSLGVSFGIATAAGMILGALTYSLAFKKFRWEGFASIADTRTHLIGAVLMGFGGVTALGCTIGQGVTGVSTLAVGSFVALGAMMVGCWATLKFQYWKMMREA